MSTMVNLGIGFQFKSLFFKSVKPDEKMSIRSSTPVSYTHLTLPTIYSV